LSAPTQGRESQLDVVRELFSREVLKSHHMKG
jgi:hypothetical protein